MKLAAISTALLTSVAVSALPTLESRGPPDHGDFNLKAAIDTDAKTGMRMERSPGMSGLVRDPYRDDAGHWYELDGKPYGTGPGTGNGNGNRNGNGYGNEYGRENGHGNGWRILF